MKTNVLANHVTRMENPKSALWSVVKLIHAINRNAQRLEIGANIVQGGNYHKSEVYN